MCNNALSLSIRSHDQMAVLIVKGEVLLRFDTNCIGSLVIPGLLFMSVAASPEPRASDALFSESPKLSDVIYSIPCSIGIRAQCSVLLLCILAIGVRRAEVSPHAHLKVTGSISGQCDRVSE